MPHHQSLARNQPAAIPEIVYDTQTNSLVITKPQPVQRSIIKNVGAREIFGETVSITENDTAQLQPVVVKYDDKTLKPTF